MTNDTLERIKAFGMTNQMVTEDLGRIGAAFSVDLGHAPAAAATQSVAEYYYPQFEAAVRKEAASMGKLYEVFYCLEKSIRALVSQTLAAAEGADAWWASARVPVAIKTDVASRIQKELDSGMTRR